MVCPTLLSKAEIVNVVYDFSGRRRRVADSLMTEKDAGGSCQVVLVPYSDIHKTSFDLFFSSLK